MDFETAYETLLKKENIIEESPKRTTIKISIPVAKKLKGMGMTYDRVIRSLLNQTTGETKNILVAMATELKLLREQNKELLAKVTSFLEYVQSKTG